MINFTDEINSNQYLNMIKMQKNVDYLNIQKEVERILEYHHRFRNKENNYTTCTCYGMTMFTKDFMITLYKSIILSPYYRSDIDVILTNTPIWKNNNVYDGAYIIQLTWIKENKDE